MTTSIPQVLDFECIMSSTLVNFEEACDGLGEPLKTLGQKIRVAFQQTRDLIHYGLSNSQPPPESAILERYLNAIRDVIEYIDNQKDKQSIMFANHLSTVKEAISALAWIGVSPLPTQYIRDFIEAGQYFGIRVLQSNKGNEPQINWVRQWNELLSKLHKYVIANFPTGFTWGAGAKLTIPPPPPPIPTGPLTHAAGDIGTSTSRQALLRELNQGSNITRNLRRVVKGDRDCPRNIASGEILKTEGGSTSKVPAQPPARPPKFLLEGRKWAVEHQKKQFGMTINPDDMSQVVAMYACEDTSLQVMNKINGISIDNCKKSIVSLVSVISSVELIRCTRVKIECNENVPLINMDNCDEITIFLGPAARNVEIVSSKSSSCNVCLFDPATGDYKELPIPEQIKTVVNKEQLVSSVLEKN